MTDTTSTRPHLRRDKTMILVNPELLIELGRLRQENEALLRALKKLDYISKSTLFSWHKVYLMKKFLSYWVDYANLYPST